MDFQFIIKTILLSISLAMDSCIMSMYNGIKQKEKLYFKSILLMAVCFGFFQTFMPLIGYLIGSALINIINNYIPFLALFLLIFFGCKMIISGIKNIDNVQNSYDELTFIKVIVIAFSTSIDSLSIGLTFATYDSMMLIFSCCCICLTNILLSILGTLLGKKISSKFGYKAEIIGGIILIIKGLEVFLITML